MQVGPKVFPVVPILRSFSRGSVFPWHVIDVSGQDPFAQNYFLYL